MLKLKTTNPPKQIPSSARYLHGYKLGFTLIELMVVIVILSIVALIAIPSYQAQIRKSRASQVEQEIQKIAENLERYKSKNFTYRKFDINTVYGTTGLSQIAVPIGSSGTSTKYNIVLKGLKSDGSEVALNSSDVRDWAMIATSTDNLNYSYLMTSKGVRCKALGAVTIAGCTGSEVKSW